MILRESVLTGRTIQIEVKQNSAGKYSILGSKTPPSPFLLVDRTYRHECLKFLQVMVSRRSQRLYFSPENDTIFYHMWQHNAFNLIWKGPTPTQGLDNIQSLTIKGYCLDYSTRDLIRNGGPPLTPNGSVDRGALQHFTGLQRLTIVLTRDVTFYNSEYIKKFQGDFKKFYLALGRDAMSMPIVKFEFAKKSTRRIPSVEGHYLDGDLSTLDDSYVEDTL